MSPVCLHRLKETKDLIITLWGRDFASGLRDSGVGNAVCRGSVAPSAQLALVFVASSSLLRLKTAIEKWQHN